jgi:hypothetical protein
LQRWQSEIRGYYGTTEKHYLRRFSARRSESRRRHDGLDHSTARAPAGGAKPEAARAEQIREFRITMLDPAAKRIELE